MTIRVSKHKEASHQTIQAALDALPQTGGMIEIESGTYYEKIHVWKPNVTLCGMGDVRITYDDYAKKIVSEDETYGTFRSYTAYIGAAYFSAVDITFENTAGRGEKIGQALAVYCDADKMTFLCCQFVSAQDTLFLSPLPPYPKIPNSFRGPGKKEANLYHRTYFQQCFIQGDIDFIFGGGTAYFERCVIESRGMEPGKNGFITAASTPQQHPFGFVFHRCRLIGNASEHTVYLGRPWRKYAHTCFIQCEMAHHIKPEGWQPWDVEEPEKTVRYEEFDSQGIGAQMTARVGWASILSDNQANQYTQEKVFLNLEDPWVPLILNKKI